MKNLFRIWIIITCILSIQAAASAQLFFFLRNPMIGKQAPDFTLNSLRGGKINLSQIGKDKNVILFFWTTWCPHCREAIAEISLKEKEFEDNGVHMLLIDSGENPKDVFAYVIKKKINFEVLLDVDSSVSEKYHILGIPTFIFINKKGIVKAVENGLPQNYMSYFVEANMPSK